MQLLQEIVFRMWYGDGDGFPIARMILNQKSPHTFTVLVQSLFARRCRLGVQEDTD